MDSRIFFDNFEIIANAPSGIARLRELILNLAVRGELVSSDGQAWTSTTLGEAVEIIRGVTFPASAKRRTPGEGLLPCLRTTNVQNEVDWDDLLYISEEYVRKNSQYVQMDDVLISMANSRELVGKVALVRRDDVQCTLGGFIAAIRCGETILPKFLIALLRVPSSREKLIDSSTQTTNIANISLGRLNPFELLLPPIAEQKRIVTKVDELMALCDELESAQTQRNSIRAAGRKSAIDAISTATTPDELNEAWKRISDNWTVIADTPESVSSLRSLILDLATKGKLVPNSAEWRECLLGEITRIRTGKLDANASSPDGAYPFFTCARDPLRISSFTYDTECVLLAGNGNFDVNYYFGKFDAYQRTYILEARDREELCIPFLYRFMQGHSRKLLEQSIGGVIKYIKIGFLTEAKFLLPQIEEQKRIVAKVDELMTLCDELEHSLIKRDELTKKIAGSLASEIAA